MLEFRCGPHLLQIMIKRTCFREECEAEAEQEAVAVAQELANAQEGEEEIAHPQEEQEEEESEEVDPEDEEDKETRQMIQEALDAVRDWARALTGEVLHDWFRKGHGGRREKSLHLDSAADWFSTEEMIRRVGRVSPLQHGMLRSGLFIQWKPI